MVAAVEDNHETRPPRPKKASFKQGYKSKNWQGKKHIHFSNRFPVDMWYQEAIALLKKWIKNAVIVLRIWINYLQKRSTGHQLLSIPPQEKANLEQCVVFQKIFDCKLEAEEILFQNEGSCNVHERPFWNHQNDKDKVHVILAFVIKKDEEMILKLEFESDLDQMA